MNSEELINSLGLDDDQKKVVKKAVEVINKDDSEEKDSILVLAGAGSGKTTTLVGSLIAILNNDKYKGRKQILCITFTNKAANEIKERVKDKLGDFYRPSQIIVRTFHSYCAILLRQYGERVDLSLDFSIYDESDSLRLLQSKFPNSTQAELKPIIKNILNAKDRGFLLNTYEQWRDSKQEYLEYYKKYEEALTESRCTDFAGLILKVCQLLSQDGELREYLRSKFEAILVDEYQDTNNVQFEFVKLLKGTSTLLMAVGDDDQSIYSFRGSELSHILDFENNFSHSIKFILPNNYRSTGAIVTAADCLIKHNRNRYNKNLRAVNVGGQKPLLKKFESDINESFWIVSEIQKKYSNSVCAILFRTNAQSRQFELDLMKRGIDYAILKSSSFYDKEEIKDLLALIALSLNPFNTAAFTRMINKPSRSLGDSVVNKALEVGGNLLEAILSVKLTAKAQEGANNFVSTLKEAIEYLSKDSLEGNIGFIKTLYEKTGLLNYYKEKDIKEGKRVEEARAQSFKDFENTIVVSNINTREGFLTFIENISLRDGQDALSKKNVILSTVHNAKGLEFDVVFLAGAERGLFPISEDETEEERRLFYVGMTRAKKELYITCADSRYMFGHYNYQKPTFFVKEIKSEYLEGSDSTNSFLNSNNNYNSSYFTNRFSPSAFKSKNNYSNSYINYKKENNNYDNEESGFKVKPQFKSYLDPKLDKKNNSTEVIPGTDYNIGDRVEGEYGTGRICGLRDIRGRYLIDIQYDTGQKTTYVSTSGKFKKI